MVRLFLAAFSVLFMIPAKVSTYTKKKFPKKTIIVTVDKKGYVFIGKDTLTTIELSNELQKRLWKSYMGTDKMYDAIHLEFNGEVPMNIKESVKNAIREGQKKALTDICLQKHKKRFEDLSSGQQKKIMKQFPVLFQQEY